MSATFTIDVDFVYAMLKEYNDAVKAKKIGDENLEEAYLAVLHDDTEVYKAPLDCEVGGLYNGAIIYCNFIDASDNAYTANGAAYRFKYRGIPLELFRVSFEEVTKGPQDVLYVFADAVLTVGQGGTPQLS